MTKYAESFEWTFPFTDKSVQFNLVATEALSYTVPGGNQTQYRADFVIPYNANVWIGYNVTASYPLSGTIANVSQVELIGHAKYTRYVRGGDVLSFISNANVSDCNMTLLTTTM
jgi:hypothetical protein